MSLEKKINELLELQAPEKTDLKALRKVALYDFNGTLASDMRGAGMEKYGKALEDQLSVIANAEDSKIIDAFEKKGIKLHGNGLGRAVADVAWELAKEPPRGTKAREAYYDLLELWIRRGEAGVSVFPDVWKKGNAIERDKKQGLQVVALSRGVQKLLDVILQVSRLDSVVEKIYSTIPYGAEKTAKCYYLFMLDLLKEKKLVVKAYEDEIENVEGLLAADIALAAKLEIEEVPYEIIWVDRAGEGKTEKGREKMRGFEGVYERFRNERKWRKEFNEVFRAVNSLE